MSTHSIDLRLVPIALTAWGSTYAALHSHLLLAIGVVVFGIVQIFVMSLGNPGQAWLKRWGECSAAISVAVCLSATCSLIGSMHAHSWDQSSHQLANEHGQELRKVHVRLLSEVKESSPTHTQHTGKAQERITYIARGQYLGAGNSMTFILVSSDRHFTQLRRGDEVVLSGTLDQTWAHDIPNVGAVKVSTWNTLPPRDPWTRLSQHFRSNLENAVAELPRHARALVPGMSLGDDHQASARLRSDMKTVSFAHLTAVSGAHMSILMMTIGVFAPRKGRWKIAVQLGILLMFVALVGPQASVLRSFGVSLMGFLGTWINREGGLYSSLSTVVIVACLISPYDACALGFVLSVLATWGVSVPARWISTGISRVLSRADARSMWLSQGVKIISIPLGAQITTLPVTMAMNSWISPWVLPAQLLICVAVTPVTICCFAAALSAQVSVSVGFVWAWIASWGTGWIAQVASTLAALPGARIPLGQWSGFLSVSLTCVIVIALAKRLRRFTT